MATTPPPTLLKSCRRTGSKPVIVSGNQSHQSNCSIETSGNVVKIRVNPVVQQFNSYQNTVQITNSQEDMILKNDYYRNYVGGQGSPTEAPDSGTCSDADGSSPPPLAEGDTQIKGKHIKRDGLGDNSDDEISCDSLNSSELDGSETKSEPGQEEPSPDQMPIGKIPSSLLSKEPRVPLERQNTDSFITFHMNERHSDTGPKPTEPEDSFAGKKSRHKMEAIVSKTGTVRGKKNLVRAGIDTFQHRDNTKNWEEKEKGKLVVYTTSTGIVRETAQRCTTVRKILKTNMVKYTEKDAFVTSGEILTELKERMKKEKVDLPQVFVDGNHLGDAEMIEKLNESGELRSILKDFKTNDVCTECKVCGGRGRILCNLCNGSKKSSKKNTYKNEFIVLKCMNCDSNGLVECFECSKEFV